MKTLQDRIVALNRDAALQRNIEYISLTILWIVLLSKLALVHISFYNWLMGLNVLVTVLIYWGQTQSTRNIILTDDIVSWLSPLSADNLNEIIQFALSAPLNLNQNRIVITKILEIRSTITPIELELSANELLNVIRSNQGDHSVKNTKNTAYRLYLLLHMPLKDTQENYSANELQNNLKKIAVLNKGIGWIQKLFIPVIIVLFFIIGFGLHNLIIKYFGLVLILSTIVSFTPNWVPYWKKLLINNNDLLILLAGLKNDVSTVEYLLKFIESSPPVCIALDDMALTLTVLLPEMQPGEISTEKDRKILEKLISLKWARRIFCEKRFDRSTLLEMLRPLKGTRSIFLQKQFDPSRLRYINATYYYLPSHIRQLMITAMNTLGRIGNADTLVLLLRISQNSKETDLRNAASLAAEELKKILTTEPKELLRASEQNNDNLLKIPNSESGQAETIHLLHPVESNTSADE